MSSFDNSKINAAYVASWKQANKKLEELKTDGKTLYYQDKTLNIQDIYMQDLFSNSNLFYSMNTIGPNDLFNIITIHTIAVKIKEQDLENKVRRIKEMNIDEQSLETVDEYFSLLEKKDKKPEDVMKIRWFENFIHLCEQYESNLSLNAQEIYNRYTSKKMAYDLTKQKETLQTMATSNSLEKELSGPVRTRTLPKAGYVDATVILIVILNIGFILAIAFLGK